MHGPRRLDIQVVLKYLVLKGESKVVKIVRLNKKTNIGQKGPCLLNSRFQETVENKLNECVESKSNE